ncbi:branched-chain amino acid ABC transporter substrate-binding protein [Herbaspirillum robiniae]|uniref:Branched-chain amino acid ABC transporter substrate-binding protein n=1 Tax=Herbaspirillum robiniae TaxID=2014887 RepID=A0ABX2LUM2_9BURK|nr:branched-chain amino acid ABC transporter substrate-binding protein [Herbaspirillum robiniae]NUU02164.1 branched-chain amino acid ABC transporter substrate-binding protein [Herbaspirillum robiniae]
MKPRFRRALCALCACAATLCAMPQTRAADAGEKVPIGLAAPLSGISALFGQSFSIAAQVAVDQANQAGLTIGGRRVTLELVTADDRGDARSSALAAQYLIRKNVIGVVGHGITAASMAAAPLYSEAGVPMITGSSSSKELTEQGYRTVFRTIGHDDAAAAQAAHYMWTTLKARRVITVDDGSAFGVRLARQFAQAFGTAGGAVTARRTVNDKTSDFNDLLYVLKAQQADAVFFGGSVRQAAELMRGMRRTGVNSRLMTGSNGAADRQFLDITGPAGEGALSIEPGVPAERMPGWKQFAEAYARRGDTPMSTFSPFVYDAAQALIAAMKLADSTDPARVTQALHKLRLPGLTGRIAFDEHGDLLDPSYTIYEVRQMRWTAQRPAEPAK